MTNGNVIYGLDFTGEERLRKKMDNLLASFPPKVLMLIFRDYKDDEIFEGAEPLTVAPKAGK